MNKIDIEKHLLQDTRHLTLEECDGIMFIYLTLKKYFAFFDTYTGTLKNYTKVITFGTYRENKNTPAFALYKERKSNKPCYFGLRYDAKPLREKLKSQYSMRFPLIHTENDRAEIARFIEEMSLVEDIATRMSGCSLNPIIFEHENNIDINPEGQDENKNEVSKEDALAVMRVRVGQDKFRKKTLKLYDNKCAITGCNIIDTLEAAHILPHSDNINYNVSNGILMRADIHRLFDSGLININSEGFILISEKIKKDKYYNELLTNKKITFPNVNDELLTELKTNLEVRAK